eukprot:2570979-Pleurochrysis_carterae.AAC.2
MKFTGPSGMVSKRLKSIIFRPKDTAAADAESALKAARCKAYNRQVEAAALRRQVVRSSPRQHPQHAAQQ